MTFDRRSVLASGIAAGFAAGAAGTGARPAEARAHSGAGAELGLVPGSPIDQAPVLQTKRRVAAPR
jgi:hypothetical protein